jgi:uncharacterized LabA/DUF88 family protein
LKIAVFVDFDNIQIGVKDTLGKDFDVSIVLEALKERGEVVSKIAYGDWPRAGDYSREMTQHAVHMVQRSVTPRGDKNGADINLALDALEMAFTHNHINTYVIVGGDSDFIALVEKLKQYDKRVFVVGGRQFTSGILQRNCHEFISYENLLKTDSDGARSARTQRTVARTAEARSLSTAMPNIERALEILAEREVAPQLGLLKSTLLQLDATFSERDYGVGSFLEFIQKLRKAGLVEMRRTDRGYLVEEVEGEGTREPAAEPSTEAAVAEPDLIGAAEVAAAPSPVAAGASPAPAAAAAPPAETPAAVSPIPTPEESLAALRQVLLSQFEKAPNRPLYLRQIRQFLRASGAPLDERSGFRGLLDLLHQAQREGCLRLHRDRKGVWRVFPAAGPAAVQVPTPPPGGEAAATSEVPAEPGVTLGPEPEPDLGLDIDPELGLEAEPDLISVETDVNWEAQQVPEEVSEPAEPPPPVAAEAAQVVAAEPSSQPKARRPRSSKGATKTGKRKNPTRRKSKETAAPVAEE